jgi:hypothetical protein
MGGKVRTGFSSYLTTGKITPDLIEDVDMMISKVCRRWSLYETADEFSAFCWTKIVRSLRTYDEQGGREIGPLSNYLYQVIMNEARRLYSKHKKMAMDDVEVLLDSNAYGTSFSPTNPRSSQDMVLRDYIRDFATRAYRLGIFINQQKVYRNYCMEFGTPTVKAFMWLSILGRDLAVT